MSAIMHMDGCHFFVWVTSDPVGGVVFSYQERRGTDLQIHGRFVGGEDGSCERCHVLLMGAKPLALSKHLDAFPDDAKGAFYACMVATAETEEELFGAGEGSRPSSPVAPDGPDTPPLSPPEGAEWADGFWAVTEEYTP